MGKYFGLFFFIIQLFKIASVQAFFVTCNASLQTVTNVAGCPTNDTLYQIAARQKNCSSLLLDSSNCESFEYHCVLSEDLKTAIEVCAPFLNVIGYSCAMFSNTRQSIMRVDNMTCGNATEGCPFSYNSTTSYKYQQCFPTESGIQIAEATQRTSNLKTKEDMRQSSNEQKLVIILVPLSVAILVIGGILLFCFIWRKKRRQVEMLNDAETEMAERNVQGNFVNNPQQIQQGEIGEADDVEHDGEQREQQPLIQQNQTKVVQENLGSNVQEIQQRDENEAEVTGQKYLYIREDGEQSEQQPLTPENGSKLEEQQESIDLDAFKASSNKKPAYKSLKTREMSFDSCKNSLRRRAKDFARNGFYYEGFERQTTCFHCEYTKNDWTFKDDIHSVHLQGNGDCEFVQFVQSNKFKTG